MTLNLGPNKRISKCSEIYPGLLIGDLGHVLHDCPLSFKAVDNQGMAVKGTYTLIEPGNIRLEIFRQDSPSEIVNGTFSLQGDVMIFTSADGKEVERHKRENQ